MLIEALAGTSGLNVRDCPHRLPRQVDREHTSSPGPVASVDPAVARFNRPSAEGETKTHPGSIGAALLKRSKELADIVARQAAALVLNLDEDALGACANAERDGRPRPRELEGVLQEISQDRGEYLSIRLYLHASFDGHDDQSDATGVRLQR